MIQWNVNIPESRCSQKYLHSSTNCVRLTKQGKSPEPFLMFCFDSLSSLIYANIAYGTKTFDGIRMIHYSYLVNLWLNSLLEFNYSLKTVPTTVYGTKTLTTLFVNRLFLTSM